MRKSAHYGKIGVDNLSSEVKQIWYSRDIEPAIVEKVDSYWPMETDPDLFLEKDFARKLVSITQLTEDECQVVALCVLEGCTLSDTAKEIGKNSKERIRQILNKALRKFRYSITKLTGPARACGNTGLRLRSRVARR